jgi:hypothetical protein
MRFGVCHRTLTLSIFCLRRLLPVLHFVTLLTVPVTAVYALLGLVSAPIIIPLLILSRIAHFLLFAPLVRHLLAAQ